MIEYPWTGISTSNLFSIDENGVPPTPALLHDKQLFILLLLVSLFRPEQTMIPPIRSIYILRMLWCVVDVVKMMQVAQGGSGWIKEILSLIISVIPALSSSSAATPTRTRQQQFKRRFRSRSLKMVLWFDLRQYRHHHNSSSRWWLLGWVALVCSLVHGWLGSCASSDGYPTD